MKVYTFLTESHKVFLSSFLNSFPFEEDLSLEIKYLPQECENGSYHSEGWKKTMRKKIEYILYSLEKTDYNELFVHSDIDVQFFGNIKQDLENLIENSGKDILFQDDGFQVCMGFFVCRKNEKTNNLFNKVLQELDNHRDDQFATNHILKEIDISFDKLPNRYFSVGVKHGVWDGNQLNIEIPNNILVHHANYTIGVNNKIKLLELIKNKTKNTIK